MELRDYSDEAIKTELARRLAPPAHKAVEQWPIICSKCHQNKTVPFKPKDGWTVYCRDCYDQYRNNK